VVRVLVVDDSVPFRHFVREILEGKPDFQAVGEASDGLVQKAEELQPDLILLDIGLPKLHGIGAARQIRDRAPKSKNTFLKRKSLSRNCKRSSFHRCEWLCRQVRCRKRTVDRCGSRSSGQKVRQRQAG